MIELDFTEIGPIRIYASDIRGSRVVSPSLRVIETPYGLTMTTVTKTGEVAYAIIPFSVELFAPPVRARDLETGLNTLAYLVSHPEIESI